jgi:arylsulfatase A-like enzyme
VAAESRSDLSRSAAGVDLSTPARIVAVTIPVAVFAALWLLHSEPAMDSGWVPPAEFPNVLLVLLDDVGYGDFRALNSESRIQLPNIDRLAARGMVFTDAHSPAAACAPARYSVLTGNHPWRGRRPWGTWRYNEPSQILPGQRTLGDLLRRSGYHTALFGKFHLGGTFALRDGSGEAAPGEWDHRKLDFERPFGMGPLAIGFDYSFLLPSGIQDPPYAYFENDVLVGSQEHLDVIEAEPSRGLGMPYWRTSEVGPILTRKALEFLDRHFDANAASGERRPFFVYYASQAIHTPIAPARELLGTRVRGQTFSDVGDFLYEADVTLGKLIERIEARGELANTLILVTSDGGGWPHPSHYANGHDPNGDLAGWKGTIWEGGHRVPLVAAWGDGTAAGSRVPPESRSPTLLGLQDLYATFAELTGTTLAPDEARDSRSFLAALLGRSSASSRRRLLVQGHHPVMGEKSRGGTPVVERSIAARMLRAGDWKLVVDWSDSESPRSRSAGRVIGLYDLAEDPAEQRNLKRDPAQRERIEALLAEYHEIAASERSVPFGD